MAKAPKITLDLKEKDLGLAAIKKNMEILAKKPYVKVGVQGSSGEKPKKTKSKKKGEVQNAFTVVDVATVHEFGSSDGKITERSFIRSTMTEKAEKFFLQAAAMKDSILSGKMDPKKALEILGFAIVVEVKAKFQNNNWEKLADETRGGRNPDGDAKPLLDTGQLVNSISHSVEMDGKK